MQQKIQFIAALLHEPELIIMDEPFSGLDPVNATLLQDTLVELRGEGKAILFSTHRMDQVEKLCDEIALISRGKLLLSGSMREVKSQYPRNRVQMVFSGDDSFLQHADVLEAKNYSGIAELDAQQRQRQHSRCWRAALARGTTITRFEVMEPTLEEIFIEAVGVRQTPIACSSLHEHLADCPPRVPGARAREELPGDDDPDPAADGRPGLRYGLHEPKPGVRQHISLRSRTIRSSQRTYRRRSKPDKGPEAGGGCVLPPRSQASGSGWMQS